MGNWCSSRTIFRFLFQPRFGSGGQDKYKYYTYTILTYLFWEDIYWCSNRMLAQRKGEMGWPWCWYGWGYRSLIAVYRMLPEWLGFSHLGKWKFISMFYCSHQFCRSSFSDKFDGWWNITDGLVSHNDIYISRFNYYIKFAFAIWKRMEFMGMRGDMRLCKSLNKPCMIHKSAWIK